MPVMAGLKSTEPKKTYAGRCSYMKAAWKAIMRHISTELNHPSLNKKSTINCWESFSSLKKIHFKYILNVRGMRIIFEGRDWDILFPDTTSKLCWLLAWVNSKTSNRRPLANAKSTKKNRIKNCSTSDSKVSGTGSDPGPQNCSHKSEVNLNSIYRQPV